MRGTKRMHDNLLGQLNSAKCLYLRRLYEPKDNSLCIVVDEAVENRSGRLDVSLPDLENVSRGAYPIEPVEGCKTFELFWNAYIAYLVTEEMAGSTGNYSDEEYVGKLFREYKRSHFLEYLSRDTGGHSQPVRHYKLTCLNHLIDVGSYTPPHVRTIPWRSDEVR